MRKLLLSPVLILAACGSETAEPPAAPPTTAVVTADTEGNAGDDPPAAAPDGTLTAIPANLRGVWDAGDCSAASETRLEVTAGRLEYYESVGTLTAIEPANGGDVVLTLAMAGEGQSWEDRVRLQRITSVDGREGLVVLPGPGSDVMLRPVARWRCPA